MIKYKDVIPDLLLKILNVFKKDMYILNSKYCLGGPESEDENAGNNIIVLDDKVVDILNEYFKEKKINSPLVYISDIRKFKTYYSAGSEGMYIVSSFDDKIKNSILNHRDSYMSRIKKIKTWDNFHFTDDQIIGLFDNNDRIVLFTDNPKIPSVIITKQVFPLVKKSNLSSLYYTACKSEQNRDLYELITSLDTEYFQLYSIIYYVKLNYEKKNKIDT